MNIERSILIAFLGNYLTNTVVAALVALVPASATPGVFTPQYISCVVLALVVVAVLTWWYMQGAGKDLKSGVIFGVVGFLVALATAFISGLAGVLHADRFALADGRHRPEFLAVPREATRHWSWPSTGSSPPPSWAGTSAAPRLLRR